MAGDLSDPEVKEEKKPIVDKIPFDSECGQFSCSADRYMIFCVYCYLKAFYLYKIPCIYLT